jgi:hypothetical protein
MLWRSYVFIDGSPKRHGEFQEIQKEDGEPPVTLKAMAPTRWGSRRHAVKAIKARLCSIIKTLVLRDSSNDKKEARATCEGLLVYILNFKFVFCLQLLDKILIQVDSLSTHLQSKTLDLATARSSTASVLKTFKKQLDFESFQLLFSLSLKYSNEMKTGGCHD